MIIAVITTDVIVMTIIAALILFNTTISPFRDYYKSIFQVNQYCKRLATSQHGRGSKKLHGTGLVQTQPESLKNIGQTHF